MTDEIRDLSAEEQARLPIFPLPNAVFFPGTTLPLHLFEPRYRKMVEDCMQHGPRVVAVTLLRPGWEKDYEGRPPIHETAGVGRIVSHEALDDGRHDILLRGLSRVRLEELDAGDLPYRIGRAEVLKERGSASPGDVQALLGMASIVVSAVRRDHPDFSLDVTAQDPPGRIADAVADRLVSDV